MKRHSTLHMITFVCVLTFFSLTAAAQSKNLISTHRVFPKMDKVLEFEKGLAAHAQKYHTGDHKWRVYAIQSGPDAGGYHIVEGPTNWEGLDVRGDLGEEHTLDWHKSVSAYLTDRQSAGYAWYIDSLSTSALGDFSEKANITHLFPKPGQSDNVVNMIKKVKKGWVSNGMSVAVYSANSSGPAQYIIVTRYKAGLKEKTPGYYKPFKEVYEAGNGAGSYAQYLNDAAAYIEKSWSELIFLRKDLGSK